MRKLWVKVASVIVSGVLIMGLAGCGNSAQDNTGSDTKAGESGDTKSESTDGKIRVAFITKALDSEFWMDMKSGAEKAAEELGVEVTVLGPDTETNVERQFKIIEDCISDKYDAIIVAPTDTEGVVPVLEEAVKKGIKVFAADTNYELEGKSGFIGTDNVSIGKTAAEQLAQALKDVPNAKVGMITGVPGVQTMRDRADGFKDNLSSDLNLAEEQPADSDSGKAMNVMENMLTTHPDLAGVYILNCTMTTGAIQAVANYNTDVKIISVDTSSDNVQFTKDGSIMGFISQDSYGIGYQSVQNAVKAVKGESFEENVLVEATMITKDNVDEFEAKRSENK
jgi:ribose transport system substrate-binding protein